MESGTIICSSAKPWALIRLGIKERQRGKIHGRVPHPLERGLHHSKAQFTSTAVPELDQMIERALAATDVKEVEKLVGEMHRFLYHNAHNITIGEIHTNYAANKKVAAWNLGRNLYDNNIRY